LYRYDGSQQEKSVSEVVDQKTKGLIGQHSLQPLLVSYDISNDKRRYLLHKLLRAYGQPLQKSVFICWIDQTIHRKLSAEIQRFSNAPHPNSEQIDLLPIRPGALPEACEDWIIE
jgi:CRISPR-associated endonuclease Cas2